MFTKLEYKAIARFLYKIIDSDGDFSEEEMKMATIIEAEFDIPMRDRSILELTEEETYKIIRNMDDERKSYIFRLLDLMVRADGVIAVGEKKALAEICVFAGIKIPNNL